jgi:NADPH:quinone reductase-like Zn-dependent oxidoreductase
MMSNTGLYGVNLLKLIEAQEAGKKGILDLALDECVAGVASRKLKPHVGKTFKLEEAGNAHLYLQSRASVGKVVLLS